MITFGYSQDGEYFVIEARMVGGPVGRGVSRKQDNAIAYALEALAAKLLNGDK